MKPKKKDNKYITLTDKEIENVNRQMHCELRIRVNWLYDEEYGYYYDEAKLDEDINNSIEEMEGNLAESNYVGNEHLATKHEGS